jgi:hypothetical protein
MDDLDLLARQEFHGLGNDVRQRTCVSLRNDLDPDAAGAKFLSETALLENNAVQS